MIQTPAEIYTDYRGLTASALLPLQLHQTCACHEHNLYANEAEPTGYLTQPRTVGVTVLP